MILTIKLKNSSLDLVFIFRDQVYNWAVIEMINQEREVQ